MDGRVEAIKAALLKHGLGNRVEAEGREGVGMHGRRGPGPALGVWLSQ